MYDAYPISFPGSNQPPDLIYNLQTYGWRLFFDVYGKKR